MTTNIILLNTLNAFRETSYEEYKSKAVPQHTYGGAGREEV
jgi:hypothetical protein